MEEERAEMKHKQGIFPDGGMVSPVYRTQYSIVLLLEVTHAKMLTPPRLSLCVCAKTLKCSNI